MEFPNWNLSCIFPVKSFDTERHTILLEDVLAISDLFHPIGVLFLMHSGINGEAKVVHAHPSGTVINILQSLKVSFSLISMENVSNGIRLAAQMVACELVSWL